MEFQEKLLLRFPDLYIFENNTNKILSLGISIFDIKNEPQQETDPLQETPTGDPQRETHNGRPTMWDTQR